MEIITSVKNQKIIKVLALKERKKQFEEQKYLVEGLNIVEEAIKNGVVEAIFGSKKYSLKFKDNLNYVEITNNVAGKLSILKTSQEIFAVCRIQPTRFLESNTLILDTIQDPGNFGTLIRTAFAFGFKNVICSHETVNLYNPKVLRAIQGYHFKMNIVYQNLKTAVLDLKQNGYVIYGTFLKSNSSKKTKNLVFLNNRTALILGNEGSGICQNLIDLCDNNLLIPINPEVESLNVAIAGAILMHKINNEKYF